MSTGASSSDGIFVYNNHKKKTEKKDFHKTLRELFQQKNQKKASLSKAKDSSSEDV